MAKRVSMRKAKEILRLKYELGLQHRQIARSLNVSPTTVSACLRRAQGAGLGWPLPTMVDEQQLDQLLFPAQEVRAHPTRGLPEMAHVYRELRRKSVTLKLLWEEYRSQQPEGYGYTQFCTHYRRWAKGLDPTLRQPYVAGEKVFVDWAGQTIPYVDSHTQQPQEAFVFVAALGASNYTFARAYPTQQLQEWLQAHIDLYAYLGGVPRLTIPDNPKTAVTHACRYEPDLHRSYADLAAHYQTAVLPARVRKPRDKAKVETAVQHAERWIVAALRDRRFFSLPEINEAIATRLEALNHKPFQKLPGSRWALFQQLDRPALRALPVHPYELAQWRQATVNIDYHVVVDKHYYSVPYQLVHERVDVRLTAHTVEILHQHRRVAAHPRSRVPGRYTTVDAHRPKAHQRHVAWTPSRLIHWAGTQGPACAQVVERILREKPHPEQGYRAVLGIMRLARGYGQPRIEAACQRALRFDLCSYRSLRSILQTQLDRHALPAPEGIRQGISPAHANVRGTTYYRAQAGDSA